MTNNVDDWNAGSSWQAGRQQTAALQGEERLLVYVLAHKFESRLCELFERVPRTLLNRRDVHFLVADDASDDSGPFRLARWLSDSEVHNVTIIQIGSSQGDGGSQKLGYRAAIDGGFDGVLLLHADEQSAPELLPTFIDAWRQSHAEVILGARVTSSVAPTAAKSTAPASGRPRLPFFQRLSSRFLTSLQNALIGWRLSSYFTGLRFYSTSFLQNVPFETNSNEALFDTEILLQAAYAGARVEEVSIPAAATREVCRLHGWRQVWGIVTRTLQFKLHQMGMLCSLKLRRLTPDRYFDKTALPYSSHRMALQVVERARPQLLLDIGCGPGHVAERCRELGIRVTGIDLHEPKTHSLTQFIAADLESEPLPVDVWKYDVVLLLDVIEHLADPEKFLLAQRHGYRAQPSLGNSPLFVISTPNIAFIAIRLNLLLGRFNYAERGILDITHKRLFTRRSLLRLLGECGYQVERCQPVGVPFEAVIGGKWGRCLGATANWLARLLPTLFAFQFMVECRPHPGARQLLASAVRVRAAPESTPLPVFSLDDET